MKKRFLKVAFLGISAIALVGCNSKNVTITADKAKDNEIIVTDNGKIQSVIKEKFDKKYYDEKELKSFIKDDLKDFNKDNDTKIKLNSMKVKDENVYAVIDYKSAEEYNQYGDARITVMKADLAKDSSVVPDKLNIYGKDKKENKFETLDKDMKVVVIQEKPVGDTPYGDMPSESKVDLKVTVAGKIKYVSNAKKDDGNTAKISSLKDPVVVVYK
ncbi:MAG: hypothetical protein E7262_01600 [Lachnospiraceae bacterium]|nr:hypothetical protein [Lachnospiraceae bacterium]